MNDLDQLKRVHSNEQTKEAVLDLVSLLTEFYNGLLGEGLPEEFAQDLTRNLHLTMMTSVITRRDNDD